MTREDIIRMAREAYMSPTVFNAGDFINWDDLHRFAALVAAAERESILDLVDDYAKNNTDLIAAIRARGQA
jgi:hypothetical protein